MNDSENYWTNRYAENRTGWDVGYPTEPILRYMNQLQDKTIRTLIPAAGNAYEAEYMLKQGFSNTFVLDISQSPLIAFKKRVPQFPRSQILHEDFFTHEGQYDLIIEQTFFCSFPPLPKNRQAYAKQVANLLPKGGKLIGLWFSFPSKPQQTKPPYGGSKKEYVEYFKSYFKIPTLDLCYNSIKPRQGNELFGLMIRSY